MNRQGKLYGIGVGPGDPELLTLKALRLVRDCAVIAVPGKAIEESVAWKIVQGAYPALTEKESVAVPMPMVKDAAELAASHRQAATQLEALLKAGKDVAFLTLGDVTVYSTYLYVHRLVLADGYEAELINGVPSFCAAAARLNMGLVEQEEALHVLPATYAASDLDELLAQPGTKVLMKSGRRFAEVREKVLQSGQAVVMVENCGMLDERVYAGAENLPAEAGYYTLLIVKERD